MTDSRHELRSQSGSADRQGSAPSTTGSLRHEALEKRPAAERERALARTISPRSVSGAVIQRVPGGVGPDTGADQDAELYLHEQRMRERRERQQAVRRAENRQQLDACRARFYDRNFSGRAALIVQIVDASENPPRSNYSRDQIESAVAKMARTPVPEDLSPAQILAGDNAFKTAALHAWHEAVAETSGARGQGTQLGNAADHVHYR